MHVRELIFQVGLVFLAIVLGKALDSPFGYVIAGVFAIAFVVQWILQRDSLAESEESSLFGVILPAERATDARNPVDNPNITWTSIFIQKLVRESKYLRPFVPNEAAPFMFAYMIQVANPAVQGKDVTSAGQLKAQLRFKLKQGEYDISPGAWLNEPFSSVRLDVGDQRSLILAVSDSYIYDWKMIANRRTSENDMVALDYSRDMPMQAEGSLEINLVAYESGNILQTYTMKMRWPWQSSLDFYGMNES